MNTLSALILALSQWAQSAGAPPPEVVYIPVGTPAYIGTCSHAMASGDGVVMWCGQVDELTGLPEHKIIVMATNDKPLLD